MCLKAFGLDPPDLKALHALYPSESVWTVDLAHLLRKFGLNVKYTTLTFGINPGFFLEAFYEQMKEDDYRVQRLFEEAETSGIKLSQRSVTDSEIQNFLDDEAHLIIALVDKDLLEAGIVMWNEDISDHVSTSSSWNYTGHYVVICGYDKDSEHYIIRDPDPRLAQNGFCSISTSLFNAARKAFGTDEDLLLISRGDTSS